jgi:septum formation protein
MKKRIILASSSPRRKGLLQQIGIDFEVMPSKYEEDMTMKLPPHKLCMVLAKGKAMDVAQRVKKGIVIGVDTFVTLGKKKLGKPKSMKDAKKSLRMLSGKVQKIYSGVAIIDAATGKELIDYEVTKVHFRKISNKEIDAYIKTGESEGKAGSYAIQGLGVVFISKIEGCYTNVIGMPLFKLTHMLKKFGIDIFKYEKWKDYLE